MKKLIIASLFLGFAISSQAQVKSESVKPAPKSNTVTPIKPAKPVKGTTDQVKPATTPKAVVEEVKEVKDKKNETKFTKGKSKGKKIGKSKVKSNKGLHLGSVPKEDRKEVIENKKNNTLAPAPAIKKEKAKEAPGRSKK